jgi:regulator of protease activity HflC (stomatin/prohibitin superfamily)
MRISMNLRWRLDPAKLVSIHKTVREDIEEKLIRPTILRVVKDEATQMKAIDAYSGEGLVKLQSSIQTALAGNDSGEGKELRERGVIVENFVIEHIALDPTYIAEIVKKQIAVQSQLRAVEEQKAAEADALVAKSKAQADLNIQVVGADRDAQIVVIKAKAAAEQVTVAATATASQVTIAAEAQKKQAELAGEGKRLGMTAEADGILAVGKAEATARQLLIDSYKNAGADAYMKIQIAQSLAEGTRGIQGYLPNNFNPTVLAGNFGDAIAAIVGGRTIVPTK